MNSQAALGKEVAGYVSTDGHVILMPTGRNTDGTINVSFPIIGSSGNYITGGPYQIPSGDWIIRITDATGQTTIYPIAYGFHTHPTGTAPTGNTYLPNQPSGQDYYNAAQYPGMQQQIINAANKVAFTATPDGSTQGYTNGHVTGITPNPCP